MFDQFARRFDRTDRFSSLEAFCTSAAEVSSAPPVSTDPGISAAAVDVVLLRTRTEQLTQLGLAPELGNIVDMADTYVRLVNERCGGVRGRRIDLTVVEVDALAATAEVLETSRQTACTRAAEFEHAVVVIDATGLPSTMARCITQDHDAILLSAGSFADDDHDAARGRLFSTARSHDQLVADLAGVIAEDRAGSQTTAAVVAAEPRRALGEATAQRLARRGVAVVPTETIGCVGATTCREGLRALLDTTTSAQVDTIVTLLNALSLPPLLSELSARMPEDTDVRFYAADIDGQATDEVANQVAQLGGDTAAALYADARIVSAEPHGTARVDDYPTVPFDQMCNRDYARHSALDVHLRPDDVRTVEQYRMVATVCALVRITARALDGAGDNPARSDVARAMRELGAIDVAGGLPATFRADKPTATDVFFVSRYADPCPAADAPGSPPSSSPGCVVSELPAHRAAPA